MCRAVLRSTVKLAPFLPLSFVPFDSPCRLCRACRSAAVNFLLNPSVEVSMENAGERNSATPVLPQFNPLFASTLPHFDLFLTSFLPWLNLCSAGNLEPRFGPRFTDPWSEARMCPDIFKANFTPFFTRPLETEGSNRPRIKKSFI